MSQLALVKCPSYKQSEVDGAVAEALESLGGMNNFVRPGQKVLLKVSLLTAAKPAAAITTHPAVVKSVVREVQKAGGVVYLGDTPANSFLDVSEIFRLCGLEAVAAETGARLTSLRKAGPQLKKLKNNLVPEALLAAEVFEADVVINLPKLKTHTLTLLTGAIKNLYGVVSGFNKSKYHLVAFHPKEFAELLVSIYEVIRPSLTIMDAVVGMEGEGPSKGEPRFIGAILASPDGVAVDRVAAEIMGFKPGEILTTQIAARRKLGQADLTKIQIKGSTWQSFKLRDFKKPTNIYNILKFVPPVVFRGSRFLQKLVKVVPEIMPELCTRCGDCCRHCPASAIQAEEGGYKINYNSCILCFCCQEVCPSQAIKIKRNWLGWILSTRS
jgi:uncharacterized protein (DUF362 family)/Pyruvate/2-oxoacid:ferredoxin oxidoreductase delta subunit